MGDRSGSSSFLQIPNSLLVLGISVASIHIHFGGLSVVTGGGFLVAMESTCWNQDMVLCPGTVTASGVYMVHCIYIFLSRVHIRTRSSNWRYELL